MSRRDSFCFKCHKISNGEVQCTNCMLSFHGKCMRDANRKKPDWICTECRKIGKAEPSNLNSNDQDELRKCAMDAICRKQPVFNIPMDYIGNDLLVNQVTLTDIIKKVKDCKYVNMAAFVLDFKWLLHNCIILNNHHKENAGTNHHEYGIARNSAQNLLNQCKEEIKSIGWCGDCYLNIAQTKSFTQVCSKPHILLWVKYEHFPYWPAKFIAARTGPTPIEVNFFQDHTVASVSYKDCFLYSKEEPNEWCSERSRSQVQEAINEAAIYIKNIEEKFGSFHYAPKFTRPVRGRLEKHLDDMIPGFRYPPHTSNTEISDNVQSDIGDTNSIDLNLDDTNFNNSLNLVEDQGNDEVVESGTSIFQPWYSNIAPDLKNDLLVCEEYVKVLEEVYERCKIELKEKSQEADDLQNKLKEAENQLQMAEMEKKEQREKFEQDLKMVYAEMIQQKKKQWCHVCAIEIEMAEPPTCIECSLNSFESL